MAKSTYGTLQEFKPECEPITAYLERVKAYFDANEVPTDKRVAVLLSIIGPKTYAILRSLMAPETPQSKSLDTLTTALQNHYNPKPITIAERYHFHLRSQAPSKNIAEYIAELRRLAATCEFGTFLNEALRDRLVCGLRSESARRKLLAEPKLTLSKAVEFAQCMELAERDAKSFKGTEAAVQKLSVAPQKRGGTSPRQNKPCYRCGRTNHNARDCKFIDATCNYCKKKGHIAPVCLKKKNASDSRQNTKHIAPDSANNSDAEEFQLHRGGSKASKPFMLNLVIEGRTVPMELDTGAAFQLSLRRCLRLPSLI